MTTTETEHELWIQKNIFGHPVPSHGGPARAIDWSVELNGILIYMEHTRYPWSVDTNLVSTPREINAVARRLQEALKIPCGSKSMELP